MRKTISIVVIILTFLLIYFLQSNFFSWFTISAISPNLFIIFTLLIGLFGGKKLGVGIGLFFGIYLDVVIGKNLGLSTVMLTFIGFLGGYFDKTFSKESRLTIMLMVIGSTCVYEIGYYILEIIEHAVFVEVLPFIRILAVEVIYNTILTIILYPIIQRLGYLLEDIWKGQKILTRYF